MIERPKYRTYKPRPGEPEAKTPAETPAAPPEAPEAPGVPDAEADAAAGDVKEERGDAE